MIAVTFALEFESASFAARHDKRLRVGTWLLGAMGVMAAEVLQKRLEKVRPRLVISAGFAGGLQPQIAVGDLVLGTNFSDPEIISSLRLGDHWHRGGVLTASAILENAADKQRAGRETDCLAGDLETKHLFRVCQEYDVPMISLRCISDAMGDDMPVPAELLVNPQNGRPDPFGIFRHLITKPTSVSGFNQLLKNAKCAQSALAVGLDEVLTELLRPD